MKKSLSVLSPNSKVKALEQTCLKSLSPALTSKLKNSVDKSNPLLDVYNYVKKKRDSGSNYARRLILNNLSAREGSANKVRR